MVTPAESEDAGVEIGEEFGRGGARGGARECSAAE